MAAGGLLRPVDRDFLGRRGGVVRRTRAEPASPAPSARDAPGSSAPFSARAPAGSDPPEAPAPGADAGADADAPPCWIASSTGLIRSIGIGNTTVVFCVPPISRRVCRYRSWSVVGLRPMMSAASARRVAAWASPSALMILARRSRSASACRAIACCMRSGISTSLISTVVTLIPHGSVWASITCCRDSLRLSRSPRSESRSTPPSTERSVVWEICSVALWKLSTWLTAALGSTTR